MRRNQVKQLDGQFENKDNMEVFKILPVYCSNQQLLSDVTGGCIWLFERCSSVPLVHYLTTKVKKKKSN